MLRRVAVGLFVCFGLVSSSYGGDRLTGTLAPRNGTNAPARGTKARSGFHGRVERVDVVGQILAVKGSGDIVTFDATNPTLSGYKDLSEIRVGDSVIVGYSRGGLTISKIEGTRTNRPETVKVDKTPKRIEANSDKQSEKPGKPSKYLMRRRIEGQGFDAADINKDGKLSPVELCVVIKDLTMERFRLYDRNGDGCIDRREFREATRQEEDLRNR